MNASIIYAEQPLVWMTILLHLASCLPAERRNARKGARLSQYIANNEIRLERTNARQDIVVRFSTTVEVQCRFVIWPQEEGTEEPESARRETCTQQGALTEIQDVIREVDTEKLYYIAVNVWPVREPGEIERILVAERSGANLSRDLFVTRLNLPLRLAEVHRYQHSAEVSPQLIQRWTRIEEGCNPDHFRPALPFSTAHSNLRVGSIQTTGFANSKSLQHPDIESILRISTGATNPDESWDWSMSIDGLSDRLRFPIIPRLLSVRITSEESLTVDQDPQLSIPSQQVLKASRSAPLTIEWQAENTDQNSWIRLQLGRPKQSESKVCYFSASLGSHLFDSNSFEGYEDDSYDLIISLIHQRDLRSEGTLKSRWLFMSHDWKIAQLKF